MAGSTLLIVIIIFLLSSITDRDAFADSLQTTSLVSSSGNAFPTASSDKNETGVREPVTGWHIYWEGGYLSIENHDASIYFLINGQIIADAGTIDADEALEDTFPDLAGGNAVFRKLNVSTYGNFYDSVDFRLGIDFANVRDIQDIWIRYLKNPYLKHIKIGNQKEPFSMEYLTSITRVTFMERSLPDVAFSSGRNIGIRYDSQDNSKPINYGLGLFLNTGSFSDIGEAQNQISEANGFDTTLRVFGNPINKEGGQQLLHLGLGYSHEERDQDKTSAPMKFRTRPESRLTDERLVDTGPILGSSVDMATIELALVAGPWSFQTQGYYLVLDADEADDPHFWGYYALLSHFLTGQSRRYNQALGIFTGVEPQPVFKPSEGHWGAWELALRHSYVDLNGGNIKGGQESNITTGLNWIHNRNTRLMFNYIHARVQDRGTMPPIDDATAHIFQMRIKYIW